MPKKTTTTMFPRMSYFATEILVLVQRSLILWWKKFKYFQPFLIRYSEQVSALAVYLSFFLFAGVLQIVFPLSVSIYSIHTIRHTWLDRRLPAFRSLCLLAVTVGVVVWKERGKMCPQKRNELQHARFICTTFFAWKNSSMTFYCLPRKHNMGVGN